MDKMDKMIDDDTKDSDLYELAYIVEPQIAEESLPAFVAQITAIIEAVGGVVTLSDNPKLRGLAYTIERSVGGKRQKYNQGHFGWMKFTAESTKIPDISLELGRLVPIIRKMIIHSPKPSRNLSSRRVPRKVASEAGVKVTEAELDKEVETLIANVS
ncbi:MAG TPA: 30S ribosomal protein S6 [Candidatus Paceibacterota bacterium]